jgi:hypothetical protein
MRVTVQGNVVSLINRPYDFVPEGGERKAGQTRRLFLATALDSEPTQINVKASDVQAVAAFDRLCGDAGQFDRVELTCDITKNATTFIDGKVLSTAAVRKAS